MFPASRDDVPDQPAVSRGVFPGDDGDFGETRALEEHGLDFAELDPKAPDLDLIVPPADELEVPVRPISDEIAASVKTVAGAARERIGNESLRRQLRPVPVTATDPFPADVELAGRAHRHRLTVRIEDVEARVGDGAADGHGPRGRIFQPHAVDAAADRGFGRAVLVDERRLRSVCSPEGKGFRSQRFAADHERPGAARRAIRRDLARQHFEVRGRDLDQAEARLPGEEVPERLDSRRLRQKPHRPTRRERREKPRDGQIERQRGMERRSPARLDGISAGAPPEVVHECAVGDHDALRPSRRSRRVDHIRQVLGLHPVRDRGRGPGARVVVGVEVKSRSREFREGARRVPDRHEHGRPGVLEHEAKPLGGILEVERHVGAAGLQDPEQPHDHLWRPRHAEADEDSGTDSQASKPLGQTVCPEVELPERHRRPPVGLQSRCFRNLPGPLLDELVRALLARKRRLGRVPALEECASLRRRQHGKPGDPLGRIREDPFEQDAEIVEPAADRPPVEEIRAVEEGRAQPSLPRGHGEGQIEIGRLRIDLDRLELDPGDGRIRDAVVVQAEHRLEERRMREGALRPQLLDELLEREVLVRERRQRVLPDAPEQVAECRISGEVAAKDHRVDEEADQALRLHPVAPRDRSPDEYLLLAAQAMEENLESGEKGHEECDALSAGELLESVHELLRKPSPLDRSGEGLPRRPEAVRR
jgi:hypothetical protein